MPKKSTKKRKMLTGLVNCDLPLNIPIIIRRRKERFGYQIITK